MNEQLVALAEDAGKILLKYFKKNIGVQTKTSPFDFVTQADMEADTFIRNKLRELFPNDLILSEESSDIPESFDGNVWMVDPLDGTKGYINDSSSFAVMIGLCKNGVPELGIVYAPARDKLYYAEKGKGAYLRENGALLRRIQRQHLPELRHICPRTIARSPYMK